MGPNVAKHDSKALVHVESSALVCAHAQASE